MGILPQLFIGGKAENRVQEVSVISRDLKSLVRELNILVLALLQLSRAVESRTRPYPGISVPRGNWHPHPTPRRERQRPLQPYFVDEEDRWG